MDISRYMGYADQAEIYLRLIREEVEVWRENDAFPDQGYTRPGDVMAIIVSPRLEEVLKEAQKDTGEPYWERLQAIDIPVPIVVFTSMGDGLWSAPHRDDVEVVFTALTEAGWWPPEGSNGASK